MVIGLLFGRWPAVPIGLLLYFLYEVSRHNKPESVRLASPGAVWWAAFVVVLAVLALLVFVLAGSSPLFGGQIAQNLTTTIAATTMTSSTSSVAPTTTSPNTTSSITTSMASTSTIGYKTQSATAATTGFGSGSVFIQGKYALYICGGSSTSTTGTSWSQDVAVSNYSSIGINPDGTCTLYNGNIRGQFNSYYAAIAGIALNATNYTLLQGTNVTQLFFHINKPNSFVVALVAGNVHTPGPYFIPTPIISYPPGAPYNCNTTQQQTTTAVRENSTSFVKSSIALIVCNSTAAGDYLLSEKNMTESSFAVYVFEPK